MVKTAIFNKHIDTTVTGNNEVAPSHIHDSIHMIRGIPSQKKMDVWRSELQDEQDVNRRDFILNGIEFGFAIMDSDCDIANYFCNNYGSALKDDVKPFFDRSFASYIAEHNI